MSVVLGKCLSPIEPSVSTLNAVGSGGWGAPARTMQAPVVIVIVSVLGSSERRHGDKRKPKGESALPMRRLVAR